MKNLVCGFVISAIYVLAANSAVAQPQQACLAENQVEGWKVVNDQTLIVNDKVGRQYTVTLARGCHDLKWPDQLGWSSSNGFKAGCIGRNDFLNVPPNGGDVAQRCVIESVQPYNSPSQANNR